MTVLVLTVLAGLVLIGAAIENYRDATDRQELDTYEAESHHRLMREDRKALVKNKILERRLAYLILTMRTFTADDLTNDGQVAIDPDHDPNAGQNGIGAFINSASRRRLIEWTGAVVKSKAPHRKGGAIRIWTGTDAGRLWARGVLGKVAS